MASGLPNLNLHSVTDSKLRAMDPRSVQFYREYERWLNQVKRNFPPGNREVFACNPVQMQLGISLEISGYNSADRNFLEILEGFPNCSYALANVRPNEITGQQVLTVVIDFPDANTQAPVVYAPSGWGQYFLNEPKIHIVGIMLVGALSAFFTKSSQWNGLLEVGLKLLGR